MKTFQLILRRWFNLLPTLLERWHVTAVVIGVLCVGLIAINLYHAGMSRSNAIADTRINLQGVAQSVAMHANVAFGLADTVTRDVALQFETFGTGAEQVKRLQASTRARALEIALVSNVAALDENARLIFNVRFESGMPTQFLTREFFVYHQKHSRRSSYISHPIQALTDGRWIVPVSRRFEHADGSFAGVVVAFIDKSYFDRFYQSLGIAEAEIVALYYSDGVMLSSSAGLPGRTAGALLPPAAVRTLAQSQVPTSGSLTDGTDGIDRIYGTAPVRNYGQVAIVTQPKAAALRAWQAANRVAALSAGLTVMLMGVLLLVLVRQIRSRRAVEGAMLEKENQFRLMIDGLEDYGIYVLDVDGRVMTWNAGAERLTGFPASEAIGSYSDFFDTEADRKSGRIARMLQHAKLFGREENEGWRVRRDGSRFWVHAITTPLYNLAENHYGYMRVIRDVTAAREIAEALQASEFRWKYALEGAGEGVWDVDYKTGVAQVTEQYLHMLGFDGGESSITFRMWRDSLHPDDFPAAIEAFNDHCTGLAASYLAEYRIRCKDESWKWVQSRGMVVSRDVDGKPLRIIGTHSDITQVKSTEALLNMQNMLVMEKNAQLEEASRVKSEFLANMSHELRTPLNAVLGFTGTILMELPGPLNAEQKKQLEIVRDGGRHLLALINEILDLSKIESGSAAIELERVCCQVLVADVARALMPLASQKDIALEIVAPHAPIDITTDARLLKQILINLIGNAVKFTDTGSVTVRLHQQLQPSPDGPGVDQNTEPATIWIDVEDTGIGIREEDIGKLFLPFTQIEAALSRRFEGTGLGLNVSKKYAEMLGATLHVTSRYGQGSTFSICLRAIDVALA